MDLGHHVKPRHALFDFSVQPYFDETFPLLQSLRQAGWEASVVIEWTGPTADEAARKCRNLGCEIVEAPAAFMYGQEHSKEDDSKDEPSLDGEPSAAAAGPDQLARAPQSGSLLFRLLSVCPPLARVAELVWYLPKLLRLRRWGDRTMRAIRPDIVVFGPFGSAGRASNALFSASRRQGIRTICVMFSPFAGEYFYVTSRMESFKRGEIGRTQRMGADYDLFNRVCAHLLPGWTRGEGPLRIFHRDPVHLIASRLAGLSDSDGWQKPSPNFDRVFVPTTQTMNFLRWSHYPMDRAVLSGMPRIDSVIRSQGDERARQDFNRSIRLPAGAAYAVINVEPAAEHKYASWEKHWQLFRETVAAVTSAGLPVVLSLHPLCVPERYAFAEKEFGAVVLHPRGIYELVANCSLVVSFPCSTILTSDVFGKPTIIYDYYDAMTNAGKFFDGGAYVLCTDPSAVAAASRQIVEAGHGKSGSDSIKLPLACDIIRDEVELLLSA